MSAASKEIIKEWITKAPKGSTHMIVICDCFDYEDYPVYVEKGQTIDEVKQRYDGQNMQSIKEVYNLKKNIDKQFAEYRSFNY